MAVSSPAIGAGGAGPSAGPSGGSTAVSPEQLAVSYYDSGQRHLKRAEKYESEYAKADTSHKKRRKLEGKARKEYVRAARDFEKSIGQSYELYQSHAALGFALRSVGQYEDALAAYNRALEIQPRYAEAIEYRAEAYLELGRLDAAKSAYMQLFATVRELADRLMVKMQSWVERHEQDAGLLDPRAIAAFGSWVEERSEVARQTASLGGGSPASW
jgi:tetratricopeptide (TPR) repeat protein